MKPTLLLKAIFLAAVLSGCNSDNAKTSSENQNKSTSDTLTKHLRPFQPELPTIGLLMYNGVLQSEVVATSDVFAKLTEDGKRLFNVITIAETEKPIITEEGMKFVPDYTFANCPKLEVLFVPSAYDMYAQVHNDEIVDFIREKNRETKYTVSNCAGAQLIGASGIADGHKIVTWIGGGEQLQKDYPNLKVQDDSLVTFVEDGKFLSSNGNMTSYISALELLEKNDQSRTPKFCRKLLVPRPSARLEGLATKMNNLLLIFLGGGLGSVARYGVGRGLAAYSASMPHGTLTANVLACVILGFFTGWVALRDADTLVPVRAFLAVGFCGGFSTFSTFSNETLAMLLNDRWGDAVFNIGASIVFCLAASFLGLWLGKMI